MDNYTQEKLKILKVAELRDIAKKLDISGRWSMKKEELIVAILNKSSNQKKCNDHSRYLKNIELGRLIAYPDSDGYVHTAKVIKISQEDEILTVMDLYNNIEIVPFSKVLWVKTGKRWPRKLFLSIRRSQQMMKIRMGENS